MLEYYILRFVLGIFCVLISRRNRGIWRWHWIGQAVYLLCPAFLWSEAWKVAQIPMLTLVLGLSGHICPLQFDVVERLIRRYSNEGELVLDPFAGLMTVPYCAVNMKRRGYGIELNSEYFADGVGYCRAAESKILMPTLFDVLEENVTR